MSVAASQRQHEHAEHRPQISFDASRGDVRQRPIWLRLGNGMVNRGARFDGPGDPSTNVIGRTCRRTGPAGRWLLKRRRVYHGIGLELRLVGIS
jgi:hypothetical protein